MKKRSTILAILVALSLLSTTQAQELLTKRTAQLDNARVKVWKTTISPSVSQILPWHRHDQPRVVVALTDGELKIINNKNQVSVMRLKKGKAYYFAAEAKGSKHYDVNVSSHPIEVMVIELKR